MGGILLIDRDPKTREVYRLALEERTVSKVYVASNAQEAIGLLSNNDRFNLVISDNQSETLIFMIREKIEIPFIYFTDDENLMIPFSSKILICVWRKDQFNELSDSAVSILHKQHRL